MLGLDARAWGRLTPREFEDMLDGAALRYELMRDLAGWHALRTGAFDKGTSLRDVLGREPLPLDPRAELKRRAAALAPISEKAARARAMIAAAAVQRSKLPPSS